MNSKMKKSLLYAFVICVLTALTVFSVNAKTVTKNKLVYEVNKNTATLVECKRNAKKIKIPSKVEGCKVTAIGAWAFSGKTRLQSVEIPKTVTKIGKAAFNECTSLKEIVIPDSVKRIYPSAFWYCTGLEKAIIPASITKIGKNAFEGCDKLTAYTVKGSAGEKYIKKQKHISLAYRYTTSLELDSEKIILNEGETYKLETSQKPKKLYNSKCSFSSSNKEIATVSKRGVITAKAPGKVKITCKAKDGSGKKASCTLIVRAKETAKAISHTPKAPEGVTGLSVTAISDNSVSLSWNEAKGATGYKLYIYDALSDTYTLKWATAKAEAEIQALEANKEYSFSVKSYTSNYYSSSDSADYSSLVTVKTLPATVEEITVKNEDIYPDALTLSWSEVECADGYNLYIYNKSEKDYVLYESTRALSCNVQGLKAGTSYHFKIKTFSGENKTEGSFSKAFTFTTAFLPANEKQAVNDFIDALSKTKSSTESFMLYPRFTVTGLEGENDKTESIIDFIEKKEIELTPYDFKNGVAEVGGKVITPSDVIYPFGKESELISHEILKDSVTFSESGYGYLLSLEVKADEADKVALVTNIEKLREENPGMVLHSFETDNAVIEAKITDGKVEYYKVELPVRLVVIIGSDKQEITYTLSQEYLFAY